MGWTSEVILHIRAPVHASRHVRRRFTHKGFQNFSSGYQGLIGMDAPNQHAEAHAKFAVYSTERADDAQAAQLSTLAAQILGAGTGVEPELTERIVSLASEAPGELVYEFSIWKDNIIDVANRAVEVVDQALSEEFGKRWRRLKLPPSALFIRAFSQLGHGEVSCYDITPCLIKHSDLGEVILGGMESDDYTEEKHPPDTNRFDDITSELLKAHECCEPDAFGCYDGGKGTSVRIVGLTKKPELNDRQGTILGPVDLESLRWPVKLEDSKLIAVQRQNLELVTMA